LQDKSNDEIKAVLENEYGAARLENLPERIEKIQKSIIFQPLL